MSIISLKTPRVWGLITAFALLSLSACTGLSGEPRVVATLPPAPTQITPTDPLAQGEAIFSQRCASCHGVGGRGDGELVTSGQIQAVPDLTDLNRRADQTVEDYFEVITYGRIEKLMPPWEGALTEEERRAVAEYAYRLADSTSIQITPTALTTSSTIEAGVINGVIENGTADSEIPANVEVTLFTLNMAGEEVSTQTKIATDGTFSFENITVQSDYAYLVSVEYSGVTYISDMALGSDLTAETAHLNLSVMVYETTTDPSVMSISLFLQQATISASDVGMEYLSILRFNNSSDRTYLPLQTLPDGRPNVLDIPVPQWGMPINLDTNRYAWDEATETLIDTLPVLPGDAHLVHIPFILPPKDSSEIRYTLAYPLTNQIELMLPPNQFTVESAQFVSQGTMQFSGGVFEDYLAEAVGVGETISFSLTPIATASVSSPQSTLGVILVVTGGLSLIIAAVLFIRQYRAKPITQAELVAQIAQLDLAYQNQQINEKNYQAQRERLKRELTRLLQDA